MFPIKEMFITGHCRPNKKLSRISAIIIHWTAYLDPKAGAVANRNYFSSSPVDKKGKPIYASAHYIVDSTCIVQCLPDDEVAFHVGSNKYLKDGLRIMGDTGSANYVSIGIEMCVNSDGDFNITRTQTIELTNFLANKYNIERINILRHFDITAKVCPKMMIDNSIWNSFLDEVFMVNQNYLVIASRLNIRKGPGTSFNTVGSLNRGEFITAVETTGKWTRIADEQWVCSDYLKRV